MDNYVGLDVSLRSVAVCVIDADGRPVLERAVACEIDDLRRCLAEFPGSPNSVKDLWSGPHELNLQRPMMGSSLTGRGLRMTPKMAAAPLEARD